MGYIIITLNVWTPEYTYTRYQLEPLKKKKQQKKTPTTYVSPQLPLTIESLPILFIIIAGHMQRECRGCNPFLGKLFVSCMSPDDALYFYNFSWTYLK